MKMMIQINTIYTITIYIKVAKEIRPKAIKSLKICSNNQTKTKQEQQKHAGCQNLLIRLQSS